MPDSDNPHVYVPVDTIVVNPGESITLLVKNHAGENTQVEVRSVGAKGAHVGHPQIFYGDDVHSIQPMGEWRSMYDSLASVYGSVRLAKPRPPADGTA